MQKITGTIAGSDGHGAFSETTTGAFTTRSQQNSPSTTSSRPGCAYAEFDSSRITRTSSVNVTHGKQKGVKYIIKVL